MQYKSTLIKLAIFALGAASGFLVAKKVYEGYYAAIAQEEIDSVREAFQDYKKIPGLDHSKGVEENGMSDEEYAERNKVSEEQPERTNRNSLTRSSLDGNMAEQAKKNYNLAGINKQHEEPDLDEEEEGEPVTDAAGKTQQEMDLTQIDRTLPYIIDDQEFTNEFDHHDKVSLYYYREDDVLCDEHEEVINNIEETVGYDAISTLDMQTTVWVRNEPLCIDYEIISINKSYAELVHGIGTEPNLSPREAYQRKQKKQQQQHRKENGDE